MTDQLYRFIDPDNGAYLHDDRMNPTDEKAKAGLFTYGEWERWGRDAGFDLEPIGTDETMRRLGPDVAPMLPGMESVE